MFRNTDHSKEQVGELHSFIKRKDLTYTEIIWKHYEFRTEIFLKAYITNIELLESCYRSLSRAEWLTP